MYGGMRIVLENARHRSSQWRYSVKKGVLKNLYNSQENTCYLICLSPEKVFWNGTKCFVFVRAVRTKNVN